MVKLILPLSRIPEMSKVTKISGAKEYTVKSSIKIYTDKSVDAPSQTITAAPGTGMLVDGEGNFNVYPSDKEFMVLMSEEDAVEFLVQGDDWDPL